MHGNDDGSNGEIHGHDEENEKQAVHKSTDDENEEVHDDDDDDNNNNNDDENSIECNAFCLPDIEKVVYVLDFSAALQISKDGSREIGVHQKSQADESLRLQIIGFNAK
eukprot:15325018-Ditylum_brightwellii.AAC.1